MEAESPEHWYITFDRYRFPRIFSTFIPRLEGGVSVFKYRVENARFVSEEWATLVSRKDYSRVSDRFQKILRKTPLELSGRNLHTMELAGMDDIVYESLVGVKGARSRIDYTADVVVLDWTSEDGHLDAPQNLLMAGFAAWMPLSALRSAMHKWKTNPRKCTRAKLVAKMVSERRLFRLRLWRRYRFWRFKCLVANACGSRLPGWGASQHADGKMQFFAGDETGMGRLVLVVTSTGQKFHYEGERSFERKVKVEVPGVQTLYFQGEHNNERLVEAVLQNGTIIHFDGPKDNERKVRSETADGEVRYFVGPIGVEIEPETVQIRVEPTPTPEKAKKPRRRGGAKKKKKTGGLQLHSISEEEMEDEETPDTPSIHPTQAEPQSYFTDEGTIQFPFMESVYTIEEEVHSEGQGALQQQPLPPVNLSDLHQDSLPSTMRRDNDETASSLATALLCCVCFANEREVALVPCGHRCLCKDCSEKFPSGSKCPLCREVVTASITVFL